MNHDRASSMKNLILSVVLGTFFLQSCSHQKAESGTTDLPLNNGNTVVINENSPWLEITEELNRAIDEDRLDSLQSLLETKCPKSFWEKMSQDAENTSYLPLWGKSLNFDENVKAEIVRPQILDFLFNKFRLFKRNDKIVHAGIEHTYGYLFSNLKTSFGYKRARWVQSDIEKGFNLPSKSLNPLTEEGSLFRNVTYFFGQFAFYEDNAELKLLDEDKQIPDHFIRFPYRYQKWKRLKEVIKLEGDRTIEIRTDFIPFPYSSGTTNNTLLIYSILDSKMGRPVLISGFPVAQSFVQSTLDSKSLGINQPVKTKYNAFVEGFTQPVNGTREVLNIHE